MADTPLLPLVIGPGRLYWARTSGVVPPKDTDYLHLGYVQDGLNITVLFAYDDWWSHRFGPGLPIDWIDRGTSIQVRTKLIATLEDFNSFASFISSTNKFPNAFAQQYNTALSFVFKAPPVYRVNPPKTEWVIWFKKCKIDEFEYNLGIKYTIISLGFLAHVAVYDPVYLATARWTS